MKSQRYTLSVLSVAAAAFANVALADEPATRTRTEVVAEVLSARAAGTLIPAGEGLVQTRSLPTNAASVVTRDSVKAEVLEARAAGELSPAGEFLQYDARQPAGVSLLTRAAVKASVVAARRAGELMPAGEGMTEAYLANAPRRPLSAEVEGQPSQVARK